MPDHWVMFYDPINEQDVPVNTRYVVYAFADRSDPRHRSRTCLVLAFGDGARLTVEGDIVDTYAALRDTPAAQYTEEARREAAPDKPHS